ncbi:hypothetical protein GCM10023201_14830 [Actinomycetospora corticicola]|uniref:Putative integral membrane protein n=2 Tax=Actinomycetospora corticicola TaxID=663602 RepID=A0A7Y9J5I3_9PSEU|nr:putative integral membrane protein [Actinomycetospora corticicola]
MNRSIEAEPRESSRIAGGGTNRVLSLVGTHWLPLLLAVVVAFFIGQNRDRISIHLFWIQLQAPLWCVLAITGLVGALIATLVAAQRAWRRRTARSAPRS